VSIAIAFWSLQAVKWDVILKSTSPMKAKMLVVVLALVLGYWLAQFIFEYASLF
jgi:uncharacterized integral membrane protein (TIGR02327 family)